MRKKCPRFLLIVSLCACAALTVWFGYCAWKILMDYKHGAEDLKKVYDIAAEAGERKIPISENAIRESQNEAWQAEEDDGRAQRSVLEKLREINGDTIGWVRIEGTAVDYPVMHTPDNPEFYLTHGFDKSDSAYGMIFMDGACSPIGKCLNYVLYGHHMKNGAMFAELEKYSTKEYYEKHPVVEFDTLEESGCYEVMAVFKLPASQITAEIGAYLAAESEKDYENLIAYARIHELYDTGIIPEWPEPLLTMVTCEYTGKNGRLFVIARRVKQAGETGAAMEIPAGSSCGAARLYLSGHV